MHVDSQADVETDEVYAQMTLQTLTPQEQKDAYLPVELGMPCRQPTRLAIFCCMPTTLSSGVALTRRSLKELAKLYGSNSSLDVVQEYRSNCGLELVTSKCLGAARISAVLIDDGLELDKMHNIEWHKKFFPYVGRILRIEHVAEKILDEGSPGGAPWTLDTFTKNFVDNLKSHADKIVGFKSIAAYRSGLEINTNVSEKDAEEGLNEVLRAGKPVRITNKNFIDHIFIRALEVAQCFYLPLQIHTGFGDKDLR